VKGRIAALLQGEQLSAAVELWKVAKEEWTTDEAFTFVTELDLVGDGEEEKENLEDTSSSELLVVIAGLKFLFLGTVLYLN